MDKPTKPSVSIPESFANNGTKTDFSESKIENGFERFAPEVLAGDNLNKFIDDTYKGLNYSIKTSDALNLINEEEILTVQNNSFRTLPLQNSLAYPTGNTSEDKVLFEELAKRKHSTFDPSKFTVVGSPVITDDGVASGFSFSDYLRTPTHTFTSNIVEIKNAVYFPNTTSGGIFGSLSGGRFEVSYNRSESKVSMVINDNNGVNIFNYSYPYSGIDSTKLNYFRLIGDGTKYRLQHSLDDDTYTNIAQVTNGNILGVTSFMLGGVLRADGQMYGQLTGSDDLKHFSIKENGKLIFSGNKTGIDVIKPDNYEVVGSPVISEDGVASGLNYSTAYIKTAYTVPASTASSWSVEIRNFYVSSLSSVQRLFSFNTINTFLYISTDGKIKTFISGSSTGDIAYDTYVNYTTNIGETLNIKFCFTGTAYEVWINNKKTYFINSTNKVPLDQVMTVYSGGTGYAPCIGEHDLNSFKIYVDGNLVYQPCLKIPYTESKTGSKIVDEVYRDRVIDLYEQQGQAGYYTIDEGNKNFTLPMGEIYGMIEQKGTYHPPLLSTMWSDHLINDMSWLRADTFSWQDGNTYSKAYNELLTEYNDSASVSETEGSIIFKRTPKGYKIALADQETAVTEKYTTDGIAWYYILDTENKKFKLPRSTYNAYSKALPVVGNGLSLGLTDGTTNYGLYAETSVNRLIAYSGSYGLTVRTSGGSGVSAPSSSAVLGVTTDPTKSGIVASSIADTDMYLYFYVGEFTKSAEAQTAGLKAELLNGKLDISNIKRYPIEISDKSLMPSWYVVYNDGWCEQGGKHTATANTNTTITLIKQFNNTDYNLLLTGTYEDAGGQYSVQEQSKSSRKTSSFVVRIGGYSNLQDSCYWQASGYIS